MSSQVPNLIRAVVNGEDEIRYGRRQFLNPNTGVVDTFIHEGGNSVYSATFTIKGGPENTFYVTSPEASNSFYSSDPSSWEILPLSLIHI